MTELDKHFGYKEKPEIPDFKPTFFGEYRPVRIRKLCNIFLEEYIIDHPACNPTEYLFKKIAGQARQLVKMLDVHGVPENQYEDFVRFGMKMSRKNRLDRSGPMSIEYAVKHFNGREENRSRYLKGIDDD